MNIKTIYNNYTIKRNLKKLSPYLELSKESIYGSGFSVDIRHPKNQIYLRIGKDSFIRGCFIFEKETGKIEIGDRVHIGNSTFISIDSIIIGDDVTIAWNCLFYDHNSHSTIWEERMNDTIQEVIDFKENGDSIKNKNWNVVKHAPIKICNKAWIGVNCTILKGVIIGEGAIVAAGSVVTKNVEPWTMVGGNPAKIIKNNSF